ncbi:MAG TPA: DUF4760 domain-containing protein [Chitinophagaceae bacterium]|jgi:hypothetical protein|nr:DUF4760 domain-containing protein [Chitinophagaceae bacterium]
MFETPKWSRRVAKFIFAYRHILMMLVVAGVISLGIYLHYYRSWTGKDTIQACTGLLILLTLFFAGLNYEFTSSKARRDYEAARHLLTFNTSCEWHKPPSKDYQRIIIEFENKFIESGITRNISDFEKFIDDPDNLDYRESLNGIVNYFEGCAIAINKGLIDKEFIREFFCGIYKLYYIDYIFYIEKIRLKKNDEKIWINFTSLVEDWHPTIREQVEQGLLKSIFLT